MTRSALNVVCLLPARNAAADLPAYLESAARFCDGIVALDDGSTDGTRELLEASPLVQILLGNPSRDGYRGWHDGANRNRLLRAAAELDPDWIVKIDADERIDSDDAGVLRRFLERDALPGCAYAFQHFRMWGEGRYDPDFRWIFRLFAHSPEHALPDQALHFDPVPSGLPRIRTTIRVQHFGAADEERRVARLRKYGEVDPEGAYPTNFGGLADAPSDTLPLWRPRPQELEVLFKPGSYGLDPVLAGAVERLLEAARGAVWIVSGYRTREIQEKLWETALATHGSVEGASAWVAPPGESMHERGRAVDLGGDLKLAAGLVRRLKLPLDRCRANEPWHFELVEPTGE